MAADEPERAPNVCANCKARKKRCDKAIPRCQFCVRHNLHCLYRTPSRPAAPAARAIEDSSDERAAPLRIGPDRGPTIVVQNDTAAASAQLLGEDIASVGYLPTTSEATLCGQARRLIRATGLYLDDISVRYFQGIHAFIPIISRDRFHTHLISFGTSPRADFALLLVCMGLLTHYDPATDPSLSSSSSGDDPLPQQQRAAAAPDLTLYVAAKSLMAQAQALCSFPSIHLIQAHILLSVYEYTHSLPDKAFVTIGGCARMAYAARLPSPHLQVISGGPTEEASSRATAAAANRQSSDEEEGIRTWWGIAICERTFLCELETLDQPLGSVMPDKHCRLPPDSSCATPSRNGQVGRWSPSPGFSIHDALEATVPVSGFGGMALAASLHDDVLQGMAIPELGSKLARLRECDKALQSFLAVVMQQCNPSNMGPYCGAIGLTIRTLYLLHWYIIEQGNQELSSYLTLDTITNMLVNIAISHDSFAFSELDRLPPSCLYLFRAALRHLGRGESTTPGGQLLQNSANKLRLQTALRRVEHRWCSPGPVQ